MACLLIQMLCNQKAAGNAIYLKSCHLDSTLGASVGNWKMKNIRLLFVLWKGVWPWRCRTIDSWKHHLTQSKKSTFIINLTTLENPGTRRLACNKHTCHQGRYWRNVSFTEAQANLLQLVRWRCELTQYWWTGLPVHLNTILVCFFSM